jgi:hypothetical protein
MHMTPEMAEQNAIDELRNEAAELNKEADERQAALDALPGPEPSVESEEQET